MMPPLLLRALRSAAAGLAFISLLLLLDVALSLALPWLGGQVAGAIAAGLGNAAAGPIAVLVGTVALQALLRFARLDAQARVGERLLADVRIGVHDHVQALPLRFHENAGRGELVTLIAHELSQLSTFATGPLLALVPAAITALGALLFMARIDLGLALLVALLVPAYVLLFKLAARRLGPLSRRYREAYVAAAAAAEEDLAMVRAIKTFAAEDTTAERHADAVHSAMRLAVTQRRAQAMLEPIATVIAVGGVAVLIWLALEQRDGPPLSTAEIAALLLYAILLARPTAGFAAFYGQSQLALATIRKLDRVLAEQPEPVALDTAVSRNGVPERGALTFRDVHFSYPGRDALLRGIDLTIEPGSTIAIDGANGTGKSTLIDLIMRLYEPQRGTIVFGGRDIAEIDLRSWRRRVALVPQHVQLFDRSVAENIALGTRATAAEIEAAARQSLAHDFITRLPAGYATRIGADGVQLSGGERQKLALARALVRDPAILVLDEATAMFDAAAEQALVEQWLATRERNDGRIIIVITHRAPLLALADRIIRMTSDGRIEEEADHGARAAVVRPCTPSLRMARANRAGA